ncbi:MAG: SDR family oxidoreductase [Gemmatimonadaceae bacterium]
MKPSLRPIDEQVIVITGASSGIGLATARLAAARGACVVLAARNGRDLERAVESIRRDGGRAVHIVADVAEEQAAERIADAATREFGRIDSWVNNAAVAMYGRVTELPVDDMRRQMDVNFWGQVYGGRAAVRHMRGRGGALINVASAVAERAIPLQGIYCAAKHALKAFTDTLRMELEEEGVPISVSLVKPGSIDTPFFQKARSYIGVEPQPVPPVYAPEVVARTVLECAVRPVRDIIVGGMGMVLSAAETISPRGTDIYMERTTFNSQKTEIPLASGRRDNLYEHVEHDGGERGRYQGHVMRSSMYTEIALHPRAATLAAVGAGLLLVAGFRARRDSNGGASGDAEPAAGENRGDENRGDENRAGGSGGGESHAGSLGGAS